MVLLSLEQALALQCSTVTIAKLPPIDVGEFFGLPTRRKRDTVMPISLTGITTASILMCTAIGVSLASAQDNSVRSVDQYTCKDIMRESGASRDVSIAFVHGYLLGKSGATTFNIELLHRQTDAFINRCLDNPNEKALNAMMKIKG
jgi:hypothetical protein